MSLKGLSLIASIGFLFGSLALDAFVDHLCPDNVIPSPVAAYAIIDLGETDVDTSRLAKNSKKLTLAPAINNDGIIIGNTSKGGFVTLPEGWYFSPSYEGMTVNFHAINSKGDLLVALLRGNESVEWMRWPCKTDGDYGSCREHIHTIDPFTARFYVTGFNDFSTVTAYGNDTDCQLRPLSWHPLYGLDRVGARQDVEIIGNALGVNNNGTVVGVFDSRVDQAPYVWNPLYGLMVMNNYRKYFDPTGWVEFADLHVAEDSTVYGTYWVKHLAETHLTDGYVYETRQANGSYYQYNAFTWQPCNAKIEMLDLQGMRITGVNKDHILVGTLNNLAMIRLPGKDPVPLAALMEPGSVKDWKLLEITDINDRGQVVGYGVFNDKVHLFLANPLD